MRIHIVRPKETKQEGNEEVSLKSTNQVISFEQNEEVLQNDSSFTSKKDERNTESVTPVSYDRCTNTKEKIL